MHHVALQASGLIPLNKPHFVAWHWIQISVPNVILIGLMVVAFVVAIVAPFPGRRKREGDDQ